MLVCIISRLCTLILLLFCLTKNTRIFSPRKYEMNVSFRKDKSFQHYLKYHFSMKKPNIFQTFSGFFKLSCGFPFRYQFHQAQKHFIPFLNSTWRKKTPKHTLCLPTVIKVLPGKIWGLTGPEGPMQHMDYDINILMKQ